MSSSVLARKRRANGVVEKPVQQESAPVSSNANAKKNIPLSQILTVIDTRLKTLENAKPEVSIQPIQEKAINDEIVQEYEARFQMLVTEINDIKDMLLKLQSFTMEINKTLFEERSNVGSVNSNIEDNGKSTFDILMETIKETDDDSNPVDEESAEVEGVNFS
jgi:hypothetical protein